MKTPLTAAALALALALPVFAADGTWNFAADGSWDASGNWSGGVIADGAGATALFSYGLPNTASSIISIDTDRTVGILEFTGTASGGTHNFTLNGPGTLTLAGDGTPVISANLAARTVTINAVLAGAGGVTLTNTLSTAFVLGGANTYTGLTDINGGVITVDNDLAFGSTDGATVISTANAGIVLNNGIKVSGETISTRGNGRSGSAGVITTATNASAEWAGAIRLNNGSSRFGATGVSATLTLSGVISDGTTSGNPSVGNVAIGADTGGEAGTVILSEANTYTGSTQVVRGTLKLDAGNNRLPTGTDLDIWGSKSDDNAVVELNGYNQTVASLTRSSGTGTATLTNSASTRSVFTVDGAASTTYSGDITGNIALVKAGPGTLTLTGGNAFTGGITVRGGGLGINSAFIDDTADVSLASGSVFNLDFSGSDTIARLYLDGVAQAIGTYGGIGGTATFQSAFFTGDGILNVTVFSAVPEPSTCALLAGAAVILALGFRRRRR